MKNRNSLISEIELLDLFRFHNSPANQELIDDVLHMLEKKKRESFNLGFQKGYIAGTQAMENNDLGDL